MILLPRSDHVRPPLISLPNYMYWCSCRLTFCRRHSLIYCMAKNCCPFLCSNLLYTREHDFLNIQLLRKSTILVNNWLGIVCIEGNIHNAMFCYVCFEKGYWTSLPKTLKSQLNVYFYYILLPKNRDKDLSMNGLQFTVTALRKIT